MRFQITPTFSSLDSTGNPYTILTNNGVRIEGEGYGDRTLTEQEAWAQYWARLSDFTEGAKKIEWRASPRAEPSAENTWLVYSRLSVIEKEANNG